MTREMPHGRFDYDVAISFLAADEPFARQIAGGLAPLRVFVFSKAQEEVAGTEGVETFRTVFRERSRLALVLFRPGWGDTAWTRVETTAIRDNCLENGWNRIFVVRLTRDGALPKWIPDSHIYFDPQSFGIPDLAGAVKARCAEMGVELRAPNAAERAGQIAKREAFDAETKDLLNRSPEPFHQAGAALLAAIETRAGQMQAETGWEIKRGGDTYRQYVLFAQGFTLQLLPQEVYANMARDGHFLCRLLRGRVLTPAEIGLYYVFGEPQEITRTTIRITREPNIGWCWLSEGEILTSEAAAERLLAEFLRVRGAGD